MNKVLVDRELLESLLDDPRLVVVMKSEQVYGIKEAVAQTAEAETLMKWKQTAEYWYGQYRLVKHGESPERYPTEGKLDDWHNSYHNP